MSTNIETNVVEMRFDNAKFEKNIKTSMGTLDRLKEKLKFSKSSKSIAELNNQVSKVNFNPMGKAVDMIGVKFSAMQVASTTAIANLTNSVVNSAKRISKEFTIEPVITGFQEYETQLNSVQTILANTQGENATLGQVNKALDTLNQYSDQTIYNFTEMTRNIGTFTAAGVKLDDSVSAIKGIANLAAVSGSNSEQASNAMYQLSQALAAGKVGLQDWNSVVNAGMGGKVFQESLKRTAKAMGIVVDESLSFRESIGGGKSWLSADVLTATLAQFTGDLTDAQLKAQGFNKEQVKAIQEQAKMANEAATKVKTFTQLMDTMKEAVQSGWGQTFRTILGDFEEAKEFFTKINDSAGAIISQLNDSRNKVLIEGLSSGWKQLLNQGVFDEEAYIKHIGNYAVDKKLISKEDLKNLNSFADLQKKELLTTEALAGGLDKMTKKYSKLNEEKLTEMGLSKEQVKALEKLNNEVKNGTVDLDTFIKKMGESSGRDNVIESLFNVFKALGSVIKPVSQAFREVFKPLTGDQLYDATVNLRKFTEGLILSKDTADNLKTVCTGLFKVIKVVFEIAGGGLQIALKLCGVLAPLGSLLLEVLSGTFEWGEKIKGNIKPMEIFNLAIETLLNFLDSAGNKLKEFVSTFEFKIPTDGIDKIKHSFSNVVDYVKDIKQESKEAGDAFGSIFQKMKDGYKESTLSKFIAAVGNTINHLVGGIGDSFTNLVEGIYQAMSTMNYEKLFDWLYTALLGGFAYKLHKFVNGLKDESEGITGTLYDLLRSLVGGTQATLGELRNTLKGVQNVLVDYQKELKANVLKKIAMSIAILAGAIWVLSRIDGEKLGLSLAAIGSLMGGLMLSLKTYSRLNMDIAGIAKVNGSIIAMSFAILVLSSALKKMGNISNDGIINAVMGLGACTASLYVMFKLLASNSGDIKKGAGQMIVMAVAINGMAIAMKILGSIPFEKMVNAIGGMVMIMASLVIAFKYFDGVDKGVASMAVAAAALNMLMVPLIVLGALPFGVLSQGLISLGLALAGLCVAMIAFNNEKSGIAGLIAASTALNMLIVPLITFGTLPIGTLIQGFGSIAAALVMLTMSLKTFETAKSGMVGLIAAAAALNLLVIPIAALGQLKLTTVAIGVTALGGAMWIMAKGLNMINPLDVVSKASSVLIISAALTLLSGSIFMLSILPITSLIGGLTALGVSLGIIAIAAKLMGGSAITISLLAKALALMALALNGMALSVVILGAGLNVAAVGVLALAGALSGGTLVIGKALVELIEMLWNAFPKIAEAMIDGMTESLSMLAAAAPSMLSAISDIIIAIAWALVELAPVLAETLVKLLIATYKVMTKYIPELVGAGMEFLIKVFDTMAEHMPDLGESFTKIFIGFIEGMAKAFRTAEAGILGEALAATGIIASVLAIAATFIVLGPLAIGGMAVASGAIIAMTALLTALGAISAIPGLTWLVDKGLGLLEQIGGGIGRVVGAVVGGFQAAQAEQLPKIGSSLSNFMKNIQPFLDGANDIKQESLDGVGKIVTIMTKISGASIMDSIASWISGGSAIDKFSAQILAFGETMVEFSKIISGKIDSGAVESAAKAGEALSVMAKNIPNSGGLLGDFFGENDMGEFAEGIVPFGEAMVKFSDAVAGKVDGAAVEAAAKAGEAIAIMADKLPNSGGMLAEFFGENDMDKFAEGLVPFGEAMAGFSKAIDGNVDSAAVEEAAKAGAAIANMADKLPNSGGMLSGFFGENDMGEFAKVIVPFGKALREYSNAVDGINATSIEDSAIAGEALAALSDTIPKEKGFFESIFGKDPDISGLSEVLVPFGELMKIYSQKVVGISPTAIEDSSVAAEAIITLATKLGSTEGLNDFMTTTYNTSMNKLVSFGQIMKDYSDVISTVNLAAISCSATAADSLITLASKLPSSKPLSEFFVSTYDTIGNKLLAFAQIMVDYGIAISGIDPTAISNSSTAGLALITLAEKVPMTSALSGFFNTSYVTIGEKLLPFAQVMSDYFAKIKDVDSTIISQSITVADSLIALSDRVGNTSGLTTFFNAGIAKFGEDLVSFGGYLKNYGDKVSSIDAGMLGYSTNAANALVTMSNNIESTGSWFKDGNLTGFGKDLSGFGIELLNYYTNISAVSATKMNLISKELIVLTAVAKGMEEVNADAMGSFGDNLAQLGKGGINRFLEAFTGARAKVNDAGENLVNGLISGINSKTTTLYTVMNNLVSKANTTITNKRSVFENTGKQLIYAISMGMYNNTAYVTSSCKVAISKAVQGFQNGNSEIQKAGAKMIDTLVGSVNSQKYRFKIVMMTCAADAAKGIKEYYNSFYYNGQHLVNGFANGISQRTWFAVQKARYMANSAKLAVESKLGIESPSKVLFADGEFFGEGFGLGIEKMGKFVSSKAKGMASDANESLRKAISNIPDLTGNIEDQPKIRPIIDLSDVQNGMSYINKNMPKTLNGSISSNIQLANNASSSMDRAKAIRAEAKAVTNTVANSINNTFNISGDNPKEIANEVSRIIQKQIDRRDSVWA